MTHQRLIHPPSLLLAYLVVLPAVHWLVPVVEVIPTPFRQIGLLGVAAGIVLNIIADGLFKKTRTCIKPTARPSVLVTQGPYAFSRNPMYLGFGLLILGVAVLCGSASPLVLAATFFPLASRWFIRFEEASLESVFGPEWTAYAQRVRRWI